MMVMASDDTLGLPSFEVSGFEHPFHNVQKSDLLRFFVLFMKIHIDVCKLTSNICDVVGLAYNIVKNKNNKKQLSVDPKGWIYSYLVLPSSY